MRSLILVAALLGLGACSSLPDKVRSASNLQEPVRDQTFAVSPQTSSAYREVLREQFTMLGMREARADEAPRYIAALSYAVTRKYEPTVVPMRQPNRPKGDPRRVEVNKSALPLAISVGFDSNSDSPIYHRKIGITLRDANSGEVVWASLIEDADAHSNDREYVPKLVAGAFTELGKPKAVLP